MNKYHVFYILDCTPKIKSFKTKLAMTRFANKIGYDTRNVNYVEFTFKGTFLYKEEYYNRDSNVEGR